ncbi:uncharacterized protein tasor2 isoform X2 [Vanacampus margaritifer]
MDAAAGNPFAFVSLPSSRLARGLAVLSVGVLLPVTEYSEAFKQKILAPLQSAYLYEESKLSFRYKSASFFKNPALQQKYAAFRAKRKQAGYSEDDLEETYGFLLFNDINKAHALGQTGVLTGASSCSTLGDPLKGVYVSMFSDCLGPERWRDGQSGFIAIIKLTTGRVKRVSENHTKDLGAPTVGFDCHVSRHLASVTTQTGYSVAFERTQCYIYELLDDGIHETAPSPSLTCPFAVVAFSFKKRRALAMKEPKPCGFISYEFLRILPVVRLAKSEVKKTDVDPNKGPCNVANDMQAHMVLLNPGSASSSSMEPAVHDTKGMLSSSKVVLADPPQTGSKDQPIGEKTPAKLEASTNQAKTEATVAPMNLHVLNKKDFVRVETLETPDLPAELVVSYASEQSLTEKSAVSPAKLETKAGATAATNDLQVLNKTDDPDVKSLQTPDVPAELIVSFTAEQSLTEKSPIGPVPTEKTLSDKRERVSDCPQVATLTKKKQRKRLRKHSKSKNEASFESPKLQKLQKSSEGDRLSRAEQKKAASNIDLEKLRRCLMKGRKVRTITIESVKAKETNPENRTVHNTIVIDCEAPLRDKFQRWNLKPVISECGRVLVPHGSRYTAHLRKSKPADVEQFATPEACGPEQRPSAAPERPTFETIIESQTGSPEQSTVQASEDAEDPVQTEGVNEHGGPREDEATCILPRTTTTTTKHQLDFNENPQDGSAETEPCLKKNRVDGAAAASADDTAVDLQEHSTMPSVNTEDILNRFEQKRVEDTRIRKRMLETQGQKAEILCRPPSIYPKWNRIKTLRKHLDISREHFKKTWWMHFERPSGASQPVKDRARDYSTQKKPSTSNPSTDGLNLLADLALGATNEQVPSQSNRAVARQPPSGLRTSDQPENVTVAGDVSVRQTLLGEPRPAPSPNPLVEGVELVRLLCKEHSYALPQSASMAFGLPGTPFQVSPLSGSTGLLHRQDAKCGVEKPQASDDSEDSHENKNCLPSDPSRKWMNAFKRHRNFVCKDGSIQVTRQWKEKYDFARDSRISSDPKDRTILRALHGPWDFSIGDTSEDMQLVVHMWIAFFYSRSTARFIDWGPDPHSDEGTSSKADVTTQAQSELKMDPFALPPGVEDSSELSVSNTSDLSRSSSLHRESDVLDLSLGNCKRLKVLLSDAQVNSRKGSDSPSSQTGLKEQPTFQSCQTTILSTETLNKAHRTSHTLANSLKEDVTRAQGETAMVSVETENLHTVGLDRVSHKSNIDKKDLRASSKNANATELISLLERGRGSSVTGKKKLCKDAVLQIEDKESNTFCNFNVLAREQPEADKIDNLQFTKDSCNRNSNRLVKGSDEKVVHISTAGNRSALSDAPLSSVPHCGDAEIGHQEFLDNQITPANVEMQSAIRRRNDTMTDHTTSGHPGDSVSKVFRSDNDSTSGNISPLNCKMAKFDLQETYSFGTQRPNKSNTGRDEKAAVVTPVHKQPHFIQRETVKHLGSDFKLVEEGQESGLRSPIRSFFAKSIQPTDTHSQIEEIVHNCTSSSNLKKNSEMSMCRVSVLKVGETNRPDIGGGTDGTASIKVHENPSTAAQNHPQNHFIPCETVKSNVELTEEEQGEPGVRIPSRGICGENITPTAGHQSPTESTVRNPTETESPQNVVGQSTACRVSVLTIGEARRPNAAANTQDPKTVGDETLSAVDQNHQPCRDSGLKPEMAADDGSSPRSEDHKLKGVSVPRRPNDLSLDGSHPSTQQVKDTKSSPTEKCSQTATTNMTRALGQPSNPSGTQDKNAKPTQTASNSQSLQVDPSDRLVVIMPLKSKPDENRPNSRMKSWKTKYRFYILITSEDSFFAETKACLEAAGHTAVQPSQFFLGEECSPLLVIVRNEDISAHLSEVPNLLELKKSPDVLFAGIDEPHDLVNLTHQELFLSGGFVMFDRPSLESLSLDKVKRFLEVLQELNETGKWKWLLHYRDSRRFKENARFSTEAEEKKHFLSWSQETELCTVLPYHECDTKSRDHPDYLACLVHLQVQNIASRFPVFVTDTRTDDEFEKNGILTTSVDSFLMRIST